jgi:succinate dehydrogenase/fumarate reductase flavoprotein subunit
MAGMTAAAEAAGRGARVAVCEAADHLGGTAVLSTGNVWTVQTPEAFRAADPDGDVELWQVVRDNLEESLEWVASLDVAVRERHKASSSSTYDPPPIGKNIDIETFMVRAQRAVERAGGMVLHGTTLAALHRGGDGVDGAVIETVATGECFDVETRGVVLASGGFQADTELRAQYLGDAVAESVSLRSNPLSSGTGLRLAQQVGAATSSRMDTFYGVVVGAVPGELTEVDYRGIVLHGAVYGVVLDQSGRRFADESAGAVPLANALARSRRALLVVGPDMNAAAMDKLGVDLTEVIAVAGGRGARSALNIHMDEFTRLATEWGYDGPAAAATLSAFDSHIAPPDVAPPDVAAPDVLTPPRRRHRYPVGTGPVHVLEVKAAMTSTFGGIRTDRNGQACDQAGSPVPGLFAAGVDQGGYNVSGYVGGLSRALVFGRRAAQTSLLTPVH